MVRADLDFDLLITDLSLPGTSGQDLAAYVRSLRPDAQVLFMSGHLEQGLIAEGAHFIQKPFRADVLLETVRNVVRSAAASG